MSASQWAFWIAVSAFIAGAGKFLDENHIGAAQKAATRTTLVRMFLWLDQRRVPDLGEPLLRLGRRLARPPTLLLLLVVPAFTYWSIVTAFYVGREFFGPANVESYWSYLASWIPSGPTAAFWVAFLALFAVPALLGLVLIARYFHRASLAQNQWHSVVLLVKGVAGSVAVSLAGATLALAFGGGAGYALPILIAASLASALLPLLFVLATLALILCRLALRLSQQVLLQIFNVASSPEKSPFTYASSLLGVLVLGGKVLQELLH